MKLKQGVKVGELLELIPEDALSRIAANTHVNYCSKVLYGRSVFYMILYTLLTTQRWSLRVMEDIFNSLKFKLLFNIDTDKTICHSSISERLSVINVDYFEQIFYLFYDKMTTLYKEEELLRHKIIRVDSTMVTQTCNKLKEGMVAGTKKETGKKQVKYTLAFDGLFACDAQVFFNQESLSENLTIPDVIYKHTEKKQGRIFIFDRGVSKRTTFESMNLRQTEFVTRLNPKSRYQEVRMLEETDRSVGSLSLISQQEIRLYKDGTKKLTDETFRLIKARNSSGEEYWFLSNIFDLEVEVILLFYRKGWDIEVFFRFLKQELNFSHFTSTNVNGIKVILYMTLITSMLVLIYKRLNKIGYKTAKRRFTMELDDIIIAMAVKQEIRNRERRKKNAALVFR